MTNDSARRQTVKKNDHIETTPSAETQLSVEEALAIASRLMQDMAISMVEHAASEARRKKDGGEPFIRGRHGDQTDTRKMAYEVGGDAERVTPSINSACTPTEKRP